MKPPVGVEEWDLATLVSASEAALRLTTEAHAAAWGLGRLERWEFNQDDGILRFVDPKIVVEAAAQIAGTFDPDSETWLWSWANPSINSRLSEHSLIVKAFGERRGFDQLVQPEWTATEANCWSMTAIAALLNGAQGAYRGPTAAGPVFMTFSEVRIRGGRAGGV